MENKSINEMEESLTTVSNEDESKFSKNSEEKKARIKEGKNNSKSKNKNFNNNNNNNNNSDNSNRGKGKNKNWKNKKMEEKEEEEDQGETLVKNENFTWEKENSALIDGSSMEGGGQILRNAVSLSSILNKSIRIVNIRGKRPSPGLKAQHLTGILLVQQFYEGSKLRGGKVNSTEIIFHPGKTFNKGDLFEADIGTAGSICLLIQISLPCLLCGPREISLNLKGGTNASNAPQMDYTLEVFKPMASLFGIDFDLVIKRRGFFPKGGGIVQLKCKPVKFFKPITLLDPGKVELIHGFCFVSGVLSKNVAETILDTVRTSIYRYFGDEVKYDLKCVKLTEEEAFGTGSGLLLVANTSTGCKIAGSGLGERNKSAKQIGEEAAQELINNVKAGGCVDEYLQDQLILFMSLAKGVSKIRTGPLTLHSRTSIHFSSCLTGAVFKVISSLDPETNLQTNIIECEGIGFTNQFLNQN